MSGSIGQKPKPRLGVRMRDPFQDSPNRIAELERLKEDYKKRCQQLDALQKAIKQRHAALVDTARSRSAVAESLAKLTRDTPLNNAAEIHKDQMDVLAVKSQTRGDEFKTIALDYLKLWRESVTSRINADIKNVEQLRRDADHYNNKVDSLKQSVKKLQDTGKPVPAATSEKLERNQEKLNTANNAYEIAAVNLILLIDDFVDRSWHDLHPFFLNLLKFDLNCISDEEAAEDQMKTLTNDLKRMQAQDESLPKSTEQSRLGLFDSAKAEELGQWTPPPTSSSRSSSRGSPREGEGGRPLSSAPIPPRSRVTPYAYGGYVNDKKPSSNRSVSSTDDVADRPRPVKAERKSQPYSSNNVPNSRTNPFDDDGHGGSRPTSKTNPFEEENLRPQTPQGPSWKKTPASQSNPFEQESPRRNYGASNGQPSSQKTPGSQKNPFEQESPSSHSRGSNGNRSPESKPQTSTSRSPPSPSKRAAGGRPPSPGKPAAPPQKSNSSGWKLSQEIFSGSFVYENKGKSEEKNAPILPAIENFKANPDKYVIMFYQTNMLEWPTEHQRYVLIHREGTSGYKPQGLGKGQMTLLMHNYQRLPPFPNNELPVKYRDAWTDDMTHQGRKLHSQSNKPIMPGRGMGVGDSPNLKIVGDVDPSDIRQGTVGDCWLLSGISSLAEFDGAVKKLFRKTKNLDQRPMDGPNMYTVTLWDLETWTERDIVIDERLPVTADGSGRLLGSSPSEDGELWACYLEKALAVHCGGWDKITGGQCTHAWAMLTGCKEQYTIRRNSKTNKFQCFGKYDPNKQQWMQQYNSPHDGQQATWPMAWPKVGGGGRMNDEFTEEEIFQKMCAWDLENFIVGAGCHSKNADKGLVDDHAYSVISCHNDVAGTMIDLIQVRNPWGKGEIENGEFDDDGPGWAKYPQIKKLLKPVVADDGIFWVTKNEFFKFFDTIYLSASNMSAFLED